MSHSLDPVLGRVQDLGGTATWAELRRRLSRRSIESAVEAGELVRLTRGVYALPGAPPALRAAAALGGVVSHESAAQLWFLEMAGTPTATHVTVRPNSHQLLRRRATVHWAELDENEVDGLVTTPLRTVVDCLRTMQFADALAIADSALRRELVEPEDLCARAARLVGPGSPAARRISRLADARAANPFESVLRAIVLEAGLTDFVPQLRIRVPGLSARVDLGDERRKVVLEADSFEWHGQRAGLERDCRRYTELVRRGWLVLRFTWEQVMFDRAWVADVVRDTVDQRPVARLRGTGHSRRIGGRARVLAG